MKKFIALILCLALVLTFCSCNNVSTVQSELTGNSAGEEYKINYEDARDGYIAHTSKTEWTVMSSSGFECMGDFYVYLPEATEISCENNFAVFCYNNNFNLDLDLTSRCGQSLVNFSPVLASADLTLKAPCYVRFSVNGKLSDIKVSVPAGTEQTVVCGKRGDLVYTPQISTIKENLNGKETAVNYIFITDLHYDCTFEEPQGVALTNQLSAAVKMANTIDSIDFIVIGGDSTSGMFETKADAIKKTQDALAPLRESKKPVFVLMGNHDDNSYYHTSDGIIRPSEVVSDKDWSDNIIKLYCPENIVKDSTYPDSKYYYYDLTDKKTRVICLDAVDYRAKYDKNGNISKLPLQNSTDGAVWSGTSFWGYSDGQMRWLAEEAMTAGDGWNYMFFSHMGIDFQTMTYSYNTKNGDVLRGLIEACQFKHAYSYTEKGIAADFTNSTSKVLSYHFGHVHKELTRYSKDIDLWQISTATAKTAYNTTDTGAPVIDNDSKGNDWVIYSRVLGEENEASFDVMSVGNGIIYKYAFGAGSHEVLKY